MSTPQIVQSTMFEPLLAADPSFRPRWQQFLKEECADEPAAGASDEVLSDPSVKALNLQYQQALMEARLSQARFAREASELQLKMYRHHQFWTDAAAVMVYRLAGFGMLCAAVPFRLFTRLYGGRLGRHRADEDDTAGTIELPGGVKASSPFLGVIILVISLAVFSLYLTEVYPIKPSGAAPIALSAQ